tara:strand:- start:449 stop:748 length:300 start_codon:yes stop_codon:yes gene_type:complete
MNSPTLAPVPPLSKWIRYDGYRRAVGVQNLNGYWYNICHRNRTDSHRAPAVYVLFGKVGNDYGDGFVHYMDLDGNPCAEQVDHGTAARARIACQMHNAR